MTTTTTTTTTLITYCGARVAAPTEIPREFRLTREGDLPLAFCGWQIGEGVRGTGGTSGYDCDHTRGVRVRVYVTPSGRLVTSVYRWSRWQGEEDRHDCAAHATPAAALAWLREDCGGELGVASLEAWEAACEAWEPLAAEAAEQVE